MAYFDNFVKVGTKGIKNKMEQKQVNFELK